MQSIQSNNLESNIFNELSKSQKLKYKYMPSLEYKCMILHLDYECIIVNTWK